MTNTYKYKKVNGVDVPLTTEEINDLKLREIEHEKRQEKRKLEDYKYKREEQYKKLPEYLDMLWHAMDRGEIPKAIEFYDHVKSVKTSFPKPEGQI